MVKINEVEARVGITKKNIRFYEEQGLLSPRRSAENGYRDYGEAEVDVLQRIKLLRKLGVPIEEIRQLRSGACTVGDVMRRHLVTLEREQVNIRQSIEMCTLLKGREERLDTLDARSLLQEMERLEQAGTTFQNKQRQDIRVRYMGPVAAAAATVALMAVLAALLAWAFVTDPQGAPPLPVAVVFVLIPAMVAGGVLLALTQRLREIGKGEMDDARKY